MKWYICTEIFGRCSFINCYN